MLFQAALLQSEYNGELALETFRKIEEMGKEKSRLAAFNRMVLCYQLGRYSEVVAPDLYEAVPPEKKGAARLFRGRSWLHLDQFDAAIAQLQEALQNSSEAESRRAAFLTLFEAASKGGKLEVLEETAEKFSVEFPSDPALSNALLCKAQLLKERGQFEPAKEILSKLLQENPHFSQRAEALLDLAAIDYKTHSWEACHSKADQFIREFPDHPLLLTAKRYGLSSLAERAAQSPDLRCELVSALEDFLTNPLSAEEKEEWQLMLAKIFYEGQEFEKCLPILEPLSSPNAHLLLALCYRDHLGQKETFCSMAEEALKKGADWISPAQIHTALFDAYCELANSPSAAEHLFAAFEGGAKISAENSIWLANFYLNDSVDFQNQFLYAQRAAQLLETCRNTHSDPSSFAPLLAKAYSILGRVDEQIALLEPLEKNAEGQLLLAEGYAKKGLFEKALPLFDAIIASSATGRDPLHASACLQALRLKAENHLSDLPQVAAQLKTLVIQKSIASEPVHLEAALDYVKLMAQSDLAKKLSLLEKTRSDFTRQDDLLSKDYHAARLQSPQKDRLYQGYMQLLEAEILATQAQLTPDQKPAFLAQATDQLHQILSEKNASSLLERARVLLSQLDEETK